MTTKEQVIELANRAGVMPCYIGDTPALERFAALVREQYRAELLAESREPVRICWSIVAFGDNEPVYICTANQLAAAVLRARREALEDAKQLAWTEIMREGALVTWGDADALGDRVIEKLESLKEPTP